MTNITTPENDHTRVAPTAWGVAYLRTFTDIPLAHDFAKALSADLSKTDADNMNRSDRDRLAPQLEARYKVVDKLILESGIDQVLEVASGVAPHGINLTNANPDLYYVETDLAGVVEQKLGILRDLDIEQPPNLSIIVADALNGKQIRQAVDGFETTQPLAVMNEGLMRYLSFKEKTIVAKIIYSLLTEFGGVWINPDISLEQSMSRENEVADDHTAKLKETTGIRVEDNVFQDVDAAERFFNDLGFSVERHSFMDVFAQLVSPSRLHMSPDETRRLIEPCPVFVLRVKT